MAVLDQIRTIVIVMMENRSFDHLLGHLSLPQYGGRTDLDGLVDPEHNQAYANFLDNQVYRPFAMTVDNPLDHDLPHDRASVQVQLALHGGEATMSGFVQAYVNMNHSSVANPPVMGFLTTGSLPTFSFLARNFLVCHRWFAPLPADTQPNRAMAWTGSALIDDTKGRFIPNSGLVLDWLTQKKVRWRIYHSGLSFFYLFEGGAGLPLDNFRPLGKLPTDVDREPLQDSPDVIFIEPEYGDSPIHFGNIPNDNHPPLQIGPGEDFLRNVYSALTSNPDKWAGTMLIITHDEHGGFFDHVPPPGIKSPPPARAGYTQGFETTGLRVPTLVVSPWVASGKCYPEDVSKAGQYLDHTSILQMLGEKFAGDARNYSDDVSRRLDQGIQSASAVLSDNRQAGDVPAVPDTPIRASVVLHSVKPLDTENQAAFALSADQLVDVDGAKDHFPELVHWERAPQDPVKKPGT